MSEKSGTNTGKEVLYIDVEDEITAIIDKVQASKQKIVALVLPKRATVLQSIVNMKLLKRGADHAKKNLVLITSEAGLLPLAGVVGLHVARSLQSKPEIPDTPGRPSDADDRAEEPEETADDDEDEEPEAAAASAGTASAASRSRKSDEPKLDKNRTVGELAGAAALDNQLDEDSIDLDNDEDFAAGAAAGAAGGKPQKGTNKKLKVPNFNKFRLWIILGAAGVVGLIVLLYVGLVIMPKATIAIKTDSEAVNSSTVLALKTASGTTLDPSTGTIPATAQQTQKTANQQVAATGQKNNGAKATGTMKITNCTSSPITIPAGSGVSAGGLTFITQTTLTLSDGNFDSHGNCKSTGAHIGTVGVTAQQGGAQYNVAARSDYAVSGFPGVTGAGSAMTGGTDDITKIVTQGDIDSAKQKLSAADVDPIKQELKSGLIAKGLYALDATFNAGDPSIKTSANPGDAADNVTVTQTITYTMLGVKKTDVETLIKNDIKNKIDTTKQKILDYGIENAVVGLQSQNPDGASVTYQTTVVVGSELNQDAIKKQVAGKKAGDAKNIIKQYPGVTDVDVTYSPFWVSSIPKKTAKITVNVQKPTVSRPSSNANNP